MKTEYKKVIVTKEDVKESPDHVWCDLCQDSKRTGTIMHIFQTEINSWNKVILCHRHLQFISRRAS